MIYNERGNFVLLDYRGNGSGMYLWKWGQKSQSLHLYTVPTCKAGK